MSPLKTSVAAGAAFILGWAAHEALARLPGPYESTAPTPQQEARAKKSEEERRRRAEAGEAVLTPLDARDPAALVMGLPSEREAPCAERPAPPCDCGAERLLRTGRAVPERF